MTEEEIRQFFKTKRKERGWDQSRVGDELYKLGRMEHGGRLPLPYEVGKKTTRNYHKVSRIERGQDALVLKNLMALAKVFDHEVIIRPKPELSTIEGAERMMNFMLGEK